MATSLTTRELIGLTIVDDSRENLATTISRLLDICTQLDERLSAVEADAEATKNKIIRLIDICESFAISVQTVDLRLKTMALEIERLKNAAILSNRII